MALTMSDYDEAEGRREAAQHGGGAMERAWITELDATRARAVELERERDCAVRLIGSCAACGKNTVTVWVCQACYIAQQQALATLTPRVDAEMGRT